MTVRATDLKNVATSMKKHPQMPDFLVIGAGKSGTTSIDKYLHQHPEIFVPRSKEPNFFGYENMKVEDFKDNAEEIAHFKRSVTTLNAYLKIFEEAKPDQIKGETSNTYMYHEQAPHRIKYYIPDVKLLAVLRQPAARLYSRYLHLARENRVPTAKFSDCLDKSTIWWQRNDLINEGFYYKNLKKYFDLFPHENIRIYLYEDLQSSPEKVMRDIYEYLGADRNFKPDLSVRYNESGFIKNQFLNKIYGQGGIISKSIRAILPTNVMYRLKSNLTLKRRMYELRSKNLHRPSMDPELKRCLTLDVYADDIMKLEKLIGRDLSHWLKV